MSNQALVDILQKIGVDIRRADGKEITGRCPVHARVTGREDNSPSWSMNSSSGLWICFSCGAKGTLQMLVEELTGSTDGAREVRELTFKVLEDKVNGFTSVAPATPDIDWVTFSRFGRVPESALSGRGLNGDIAHHYGIRWDSADKCWIIPIISHTGELMGWQAKKAGYVRNYPEGTKKSATLFGLDKFKSKTAVLVESPLDVVRFADVIENPQALASFGASLSESQIDMLTMVAERLIIAMDNDKAGWVSARNLYRFAPRFRKGIMFFHYGTSSAKDIGEMTDSEIVRGIAKSTKVPPWVE